MIKRQIMKYAGRSNLMRSLLHIVLLSRNGDPGDDGYVSASWIAEILDFSSNMWRNKDMKNGKKYHVENKSKWSSHSETHERWLTPKSSNLGCGVMSGKAFIKELEYRHHLGILGGFWAENVLMLEG